MSLIDSIPELLGFLPVYNQHTTKTSNYFVMRYPKTIELCLSPKQGTPTIIAIYSPNELFDECHHDPITYNGIINYYESL